MNMPGQTTLDISSILSDPTLTEEQRRRLLMALQDMDTSMQQDYLTSMAQMSPEERSAALDALSRPYEEERATLRDELSQNYDMLNAESPQGQMAGNNQFAVFVGANPLEHLASGINKYQAGKGLRSNREEMKKLNEQQGSATKGMLGARIDAINAKAYSGALREPDAQLSDEEYFKKYGYYRQVGA